MITAQELRGRLGVSLDDETTFESIRQGVIKLWEKMTARKWTYVEEDVQSFACMGYVERVLHLSRRPVEEVLEVSGRLVGSKSWVVISEDNWLLDNPESGRLELLSVTVPQHYKVIYSGGYVTAPDDIREVLILQARYLAERYAGDRLFVKGQTTKDGGATFLEDSTLHPAFRSLANTYRATV